MRTAYQVARLGTVSGAAETLGLHRVTVIRHVDLLEAALGEKLFIRHARGYTPTEAGQELMRVAHSAEEQFDHMAARIRAQSEIRAGELIITSLPVTARLLMPAFQMFRARHPEVSLRHIASARTLKLEKGEAHIAVRSAPNPAEPDNVVQPLTRMRIGLFAAKSYLESAPSLTKKADLKRHALIDLEPDAGNSGKIYRAWMANLGETRVAFRSNNLSVLSEAMMAGIGLAFIPIFEGQSNPALEQVLPEAVREHAEINVVTHVDLHRTPRIQAFLGVLKQTMDRER